MSTSSDAPIPGYLAFDPDDPFENRAGPFFWSQSPDGKHLFAIKILARHCNSQGIVHGGLLMTMIDLALVALAKQQQDEKFVTISLNSEFIASAREGDVIEASGELMRSTRSMAFVRGQVQCGAQILLSASAVLKRIGPR